MSKKFPSSANMLSRWHHRETCWRGRVYTYTNGDEAAGSFCAALDPRCDHSIGSGFAQPSPAKDNKGAEAWTRGERSRRLENQLRLRKRVLIYQSDDQKFIAVGYGASILG